MHARARGLEHRQTPVRKATTYRHPNPTKAAKGQTKTRLEPDGVRAETVTQIALWRYHEGIGYDTIARRLNADPFKYPPPEPPNREGARGAWGKTSVCEVLRNPKYTGYQVFNRRASRSRHGKVNDPVKWVWSTEPAHEPLIPKWMYDELTARRQARRGSRDGNSPNTHPATRRTYVLRGMVFCGCGRRMFGTHRHNITYYQCWPRSNNRGRPDEHASHTKAVYVREDAVLEAITRFFADRVLGPHRRDIVAADLAGIDDRTERERRFERERLQRVVADVTRRQSSVLRQAQNGDSDDPFSTALRSTYNDLDAEKTAALSLIAQLDATDEARPSRPGAALLEALPYLTLNLTTAPEPLVRRLFEITQVAIRLHDNSDYVTITTTLPAG